MNTEELQREQWSVQGDGTPESVRAVAIVELAIVARFFVKIVLELLFYKTKIDLRGDWEEQS